MTFLETLETLFGTKELYEVLRLKKTATETEIKRAYRKLSLEVHPDRVTESDKASATEKFQALSKVHTILSDKDKRTLYDESGEVDDDLVIQERDWDVYWRLLFKKITVEDIEEFEKIYKGSDEEVNDLEAAYIDYEGDMEAILENVLCATIEDEERFREILQKQIAAGKLPKYRAFTDEGNKKKKSRREKADREAAEAEEMAKELGLNDKSNDALKQLILKRQNERQDIIAGLEAKYCKPKKQKTSKGKKK